MRDRIVLRRKLFALSNIPVEQYDTQRWICFIYNHNTLGNKYAIYIRIRIHWEYLGREEKYPQPISVHYFRRIISNLKDLYGRHKVWCGENERYIFIAASVFVILPTNKINKRTDWAKWNGSSRRWKKGSQRVGERENVNWYYFFIYVFVYSSIGTFHYSACFTLQFYYCFLRFIDPNRINWKCFLLFFFIFLNSALRAVKKTNENMREIESDETFLLFYYFVCHVVVIGICSVIWRWWWWKAFQHNFDVLSSLRMFTYLN